MRIAYCIICHKNSKILRETINILSKNNDIYLHIDKKSKIEEFKEFENSVNFLEDRVDVRWGGFSQIEATINLIKECNKKIYDYIFLLSGDCLPLKSDYYIKKFLRENYPREYVALDYKCKDIDSRVKYKYSSMHLQKNPNIAIRVIRKIQKELKLMKKNEYYSKLPTLYKGTSWFAITQNLGKYILKFLDENEQYIRAFKYSFCCDEVFFHTIIFNSKYREFIYHSKDKSNICYDALRYIDWRTGPEYPKILDESDFNKILNTECLFGRKFSDKLDLSNYEKIFNIYEGEQI